MENGDNEDKGLSVDDQQIFALLASARRDYEDYLKVQENYTQNWFLLPNEDDFTWEKPLTVVLCGC
jgi:hypothetical protein